MSYLAPVLAAESRWDEVEAIAEAKELWASPEQSVWHPIALIASGDGRLARGDLDGASERFGTALAMGRETSNGGSCRRYAASRDRPHRRPS